MVTQTGIFFLKKTIRRFIIYILQHKSFLYNPFFFFLLLAYKRLYIFIHTEGVDTPGGINVIDPKLEVILMIRRVLPLRRSGNKA